MFRIPKTYNAFLICFAFVFRMLFVNMSALASDLTPQHKHFFQTYHSTLLKRGKRFETLHSSQTGIVTASDECEENEEDTRLKMNSPFIGIVLNNFLHSCQRAVKIITAPANPILYTSSPPYLTLQVIRI